MRTLLFRMLFFALFCAMCTACSAPRGIYSRTVDDMTGCWISEDFNPTSLLAQSTNPDRASIVHEKMLLQFSRIDGTEFLVLGYIFEWDKDESYVLGPTYQNGVFDTMAKKLTFGFPKGSLDHLTQIDKDTLIYIHSKSSDKSAMSARRLKRISCEEAKNKELALRKRQLQLQQ